MKKTQLFPNSPPNLTCHPIEIPGGLVLSNGLIALILENPEIRRELQKINFDDLNFEEIDNFYFTSFSDKYGENQVVILKTIQRMKSNFTAMLLSEL